MCWNGRPRRAPPPMANWPRQGGHELLLRRRIDFVVVVGPPAMTGARRSDYQSGRPCRGYRIEQIAYCFRSQNWNMGSCNVGKVLAGTRARRGSP